MSELQERALALVTYDWTPTIEIAEALGKNHSFTYRMLQKWERYRMVERRLVSRDREGRGTRVEAEWRRIA
jgi:predicted transcriptional regulator